MRFPWVLVAVVLFAGVAGAAPKAKKPKVAPAPKVAVREEVPVVAEAAPARKDAPPPKPMSEEDFQAVLDAIHDAGSYSSNKLSALQLAADGKGFRMEQVGQVVDLFSFSEDKINVVKALKPSIVDPPNAAALLAHFSFATDKDAVQKLLGQ